MISYPNDIFLDYIHIKIKENMPMIIGKISKNEKKVKFNIEIHCTNCGKTVPGGLQAGEKYSQTKAFKTELENFKKNYLCGICRDKKRLEKH